MKQASFRRVWLAVLALPLIATACTDRLVVPLITEEPPPSQQLALLSCVASVQAGTVACDDAQSTSSGNALFERIVGGQGTYVRLTSSGVSYSGGIFAFNVTVQNLTESPMATVDGSTPHPGGVRVFFSEAPTATSGTGEITVANATGVSTFTATSQPYFQYGGEIGGSLQTELGADGILSSGEVSSAKNWQLNIPSTVETFSFGLLVATEIPAGALSTLAPQVSSVSPATLTPGATATITGINFDATPASNTVTIGGRTAVVTGGTTNQLQVTVPCVSSGNLPVVVSTGGRTGATYAHPLQVTQHTVGVGEMVLIGGASDVACNELTSAGGPARYVVSVFSNSTSPTSNAPFQFSADMPGVEAGPAPEPLNANQRLTAPRLSFEEQLDLASRQHADERHYELLEANRQEYERLYARFGDRPLGPRPNRDVVNADPPLNRNFRISNIFPPAGQTICSSYYVVAATRVYFDGKLAIYEDDATPDAFRAANNPTMALNYQRIGDQFNNDMEPIVREHFGDILRRDAETDNNGVLIALFTPRINNSFSGVAGFVVSCDQFPNDDTSTPAPGGPYTSSAGAMNGASNFGEFFYAYQPVVNSPGYSGNTPENWYRTIRSTFIHEAKHVASQAARVANNAPSYEASWLEEGTARHVEELWGRLAVDNVPWKGNIGYGSASNPINYYCDVRPSGWPECDANPRRPASIMQRHFSSLYTHIFGTNARLLSPFGATASDNASYFYAISWSLVRHAVDRYAVSEADFFTALTQSTTSGITNLTARAGVSPDRLLAGWNLALAVDDYPLFASTPSNDIQFQTWNFRNVYAGMHTDFPSTFSLAYPLVPAARSFGTFAPTTITTLRGGGSLWYEISGTQTQPQLLRLESSGGGTPPTTLRMAITRVE